MKRLLLSKFNKLFSSLSLSLTFFLMQGVSYGQCDFPIITTDVVRDIGISPVNQGAFFAGCTPVNLVIVLQNKLDVPYTVLCTLQVSQSYDLSQANIGEFSEIIPDPIPGDDFTEFVATITLPDNTEPSEGIGQLIFTAPISSSYNPNDQTVHAYLTVSSITQPGCAIFTDYFSVVPENSRVVGMDGFTTNLSNYAYDVPGDGITPYNSLFQVPSPPATVADLVFQNVIIHGEFVIDLPEYQFSMNSNIMLAPGASIVIMDNQQGNVKLNIIESEIRGCMEMWESITVRDGGEFLLSGSLIKDGKEAIRAEDMANITVSGNSFRNNNIGLYVPPASSNTVFVNDFSGNTFETTERLKAPFYLLKSYAGVEVNNISQFVSLASQSDVPNTYRNLYNGIIARNSNVIVKNSVFNDIVKEVSPSLSGYGIYVESKIKDRFFIQEGYGKGEGDAISFNNCSWGVFSNGSNISVTKNHMVRMGTGVEVQHSQYRDLSVKQNRINASDYGIRLFQNVKVNFADILDNIINIDDVNNQPNATSATGILAEENYVSSAKWVNGYKINNNDINLSNAKRGISFSSGWYADISNNTVMAVADPISDFKGIELNGALLTKSACNYILGNSQSIQQRGFHIKGSARSKLSCNLLDEVSFGVNFFGMCDMTSYKGNKIYDAYDGLLLGSYSTNGSDTYIGEQPFNGNLWEGSYGHSPAFYQLVIPDDAVNSRFLIDVNHPQYAQQRPQGILPSNGWFVGQNPISQTSFSCTATNSCPDGYGAPVEGFLDGFETKVAKKQVESGLCEEAINWTASRHLYKFLMDNPDSAQQDRQMLDFLDSAALTTIGLFYEIEKSMDGLFELTTSEQTQLDDNRVLIASKMAEIYEIDSLLKTGVSPQEAAQLNAQRSSAAQALEASMESQDSLMVTLDEVKTAVAAEIQSVNNAIVTTAVFEENQKQVNDILLTTVMLGHASYTQSQESDILDISEQCFICGGDAVFQARALNAKISPSAQYDDDDLCANASQPLKKPTTANDGAAAFRFQPNPTSGWLSVETVDGTPFHGRLVVFDAFGRQMFSQTLDMERKHSMSVDLTSLPAGLYACTLYKDGVPAYSERISLIK